MQGKRNAGYRILVLDGQGGGMGVELMKQLAPHLPAGCELLAVGTNVMATTAMLRAGAHRAATGENALIYNVGRADLVLGPIGLLLANGIMGEVSPSMAQAVASSDAEKILIPTASCGVWVSGTEELRLDEYIQRAAARALRLAQAALGENA